MRLLARPIVILAVGAVCATGVAPSGASPSAQRDIKVSRSEFRAIDYGMTRAQVVRVTRRAAFTSEAVGRCVVRHYVGWDREHVDVDVLFDPRGDVAIKLAYGDGANVTYECVRAPADLERD